MADEEKQDDTSNKDMQAKMEFIVNQQAQFAANIQVHEERLSRLENIVTRLAEATINGTEKINSQFAVLTDAHIRLEEAQRRTEEAQRRTEEAFARLAESQAHTDKRLDALIDIVREGRNGKS
jgi:hypothetical protein